MNVFKYIPLIVLTVLFLRVAVTTTTQSTTSTQSVRADKPLMTNKVKSTQSSPTPTVSPECTNVIKETKAYSASPEVESELMETTDEHESIETKESMDAIDELDINEPVESMELSQLSKFSTLPDFDRIGKLWKPHVLSSMEPDLSESLEPSTNPDGMKLDENVRAKRKQNKKEKNKKKRKKNNNKKKGKKIKKIPRRRKTPKSQIYCSSPSRLYLYKNRKYLGSIYSWNRYIHRSVYLKRGDVVFVRVIPRVGLKYGRYGAICSVVVPYGVSKRVRVRVRHRYRVRQRIKWKGKKGKAGKKYRYRWVYKYRYRYVWRKRYSYRYRYISTGVSKRWKVRKGYRFGRGRERFVRLVNVCVDRKRWEKCLKVKTGLKCRSYPYKRVGGGYVWASEKKKEWKRGWKKGHEVYMRYVYGNVRCKGGRPVKPGKPSKPGKPGKPNRPGKPGRPNRPGKPGRPNRPGKPGRPNRPGKPGRPNRPGKPWKPDEQCECVAVKPTMSYCYYWTDEKNKLCNSRPCGQKYECVGPAKRGRMNCISRRVKYVIVPKYFGAKKCKYEKAKRNVRHVVPYDFPEGS